MQQELIEMLEEMVKYFDEIPSDSYYYRETAAILDEAEKLLEKAKNSAKESAVPQGIPAHEVIDAIEAWKSAWAKVPPFGNKVNKATREAITFSHNTLFQLLWSAQQAQRMPLACPTPTGCGPHGCHGACITAAPSQEPSFCDYCGGNDEDPQDHCMDCERPSQPVTLTEDEIDENTVWLDQDPLDTVRHCDVSATVHKCIAALRAKENKL